MSWTEAQRKWQIEQRQLRRRSVEATRAEMDADPQTAVNRGFCLMCPGVHKWPHMYSHVVTHGFTWSAFLKRYNLAKDTKRVAAAVPKDEIRRRKAARSRQRARDKRRYVSSEVLAVCRANIRKAQTVRKPDWIICLDCGQLLASLNQNHLAQHSLDQSSYKAKWGYKSSTKLASENYSLNQYGPR